MNLSEQLKLAVFSGNQLQNEINRKVKRGKPEDTLPVRVIDKAASTYRVIAYYPHFADALDDVDAALILSQSQYWYTPDENGRAKLKVKDCFGVYWLAKSTQDFMTESGLTYKRVRNAIALLVEKGIIETTVMRFNKQPTVHLRILAANGADHLKGVLQLSNVQGCSNGTTLCPMEHPSAPENTPCSIGQMHNRDYPETTKDYKEKGKPAPASLGTESTFLIGKDDQGEAPQNPKPSLGDLGKTPAPYNLKGKVALVVQWEKATGQSLDPIQATMLQKSMVKQYKAGKDPRALMTWTLANRGKLTWGVDPRDSSSNNLDRPNAEYYTKHWRVACKLMEKEIEQQRKDQTRLATHAAPAPAQQPAAPVSLPKVNQTPAKAQKTIQELMAYWAPREFCSIGNADFNRLVAAGAVQEVADGAGTRWIAAGEYANLQPA